MVDIQHNSHISLQYLDITHTYADNCLSIKSKPNHVSKVFLDISVDYTNFLEFVIFTYAKFTLSNNIMKPKDDNTPFINCEINGFVGEVKFYESYLVCYEFLINTLDSNCIIIFSEICILKFVSWSHLYYIKNILNDLPLLYNIKPYICNDISLSKKEFIMHAANLIFKFFKMSDDFSISINKFKELTKRFFEKSSYAPKVSDDLTLVIFYFNGNFNAYLLKKLWCVGYILTMKQDLIIAIDSDFDQLVENIFSKLQ